MNNILTFEYWFNLRPQPFLPFAQKGFIGLIILLAAVALLIAIFKNRAGVYRGVLNRLYSFCFGNAIIGLLLFFFDYESVPFFAARFWIALWGLAMLAWLFFILRKFKRLPVNREELEKEKERQKYLPR